MISLINFYSAPKQYFPDVPYSSSIKQKVLASKNGTKILVQMMLLIIYV